MLGRQSSATRNYGYNKARHVASKDCVSPSRISFRQRSTSRREDGQYRFIKAANGHECLSAHHQASAADCRNFARSTADVQSSQDANVAGPYTDKMRDPVHRGRYPHAAPFRRGEQLRTNGSHPSSNGLRSHLPQPARVDRSQIGVKQQQKGAASGPDRILPDCSISARRRTKSRTRTRSLEASASGSAQRAAWPHSPRFPVPGSQSGAASHRCIQSMQALRTLKK